MAKIAKPDAKESTAGGIGFIKILQYSGSLTMPPCTEGVTFLILHDPLDFRVSDLNSIKNVVKFKSWDI